MEGKAIKRSLCLLESFSPMAWQEEAYVKMPPFISESFDGSLLLVPMASETERVFDGLRAKLGLRKMQSNQSFYLTSRNDTIKALRMFNWFVRRSWRNKELAVLWALIHECRTRGQASSASVPLEALASMTGYELKFCSETISRLFGPNNHQAHDGTYNSFNVDVAKAYQLLAKFLEETPSETEELFMHTLCSEAGASVAELYEQVSPYNLTIGALYKTTERLKRNGYVRTAKHFRMNDRGPMREFLASDCRNCFYGFSGAESCLEDAFRRLEYILKKYYGKDLSEAERTNSHNAMRSVPLSPRVLRKALETLSLIQRMKSLMSEGQVASLLSKIGEWYDIELAVRLEKAEDLSIIGSNPN